MFLRDADRKRLLSIARGSVTAALTGIEYKIDCTEMPPSLYEKRGVFVTITKDKKLRGCIGYAESEHPLFECVSMISPKAALNDPRFESVTIPELETINIEISVLSGLRRVYEITHFVPGVDGLCLRTSTHRGLLLPQVAIENDWDGEAFFKHLLIKAGLENFNPELPDNILYTFTADVFNESLLETKG